MILTAGVAGGTFFAGLASLSPPWWSTWSERTLDSSRATRTPRVELPFWSSRGENAAKPQIPGTTHMMIPPTPDLAGMPTSTIQAPAPLYMPQVIIVDTVRLTTHSGITCSPVFGLRPWFASVAATTATSRQSTDKEQAMVYASSAKRPLPLVRRSRLSASSTMVRLLALVAISLLYTASSRPVPQSAPSDMALKSSVERRKHSSDDAPATRPVVQIAPALT
mmetsp:Transcript_19100/g.65611  ORF Transcript_19100/g.65611 Transcript_19100/m.65611 type:complete len:222 (-) Transcript_19100:2934-3599(-)